jgi:hypothetical protein
MNCKDTAEILGGSRVWGLGFRVWVLRSLIDLHTHQSHQIPLISKIPVQIYTHTDLILVNPPIREIRVQPSEFSQESVHPTPVTPYFSTKALPSGGIEHKFTHTPPAPNCKLCQPSSRTVFWSANIRNKKSKVNTFHEILIHILCLMSLLL